MSFAGVGRGGCRMCAATTIPTAFNTDTPSMIRIGTYDSSIGEAAQEFVKSFTYCAGKLPHAPRSVKRTRPVAPAAVLSEPIGFGCLYTVWCRGFLSYLCGTSPHGPQAPEEGDEDDDPRDPVEGEAAVSEDRSEGGDDADPPADGHDEGEEAEDDGDGEGDGPSGPGLIGRELAYGLCAP